MKENLLIDKSIAFVARIVKLHQHLVKNKKETIILKQIVRSGTSIVANINEANYGQSKADFISKMHIALKGNAETEYWFKLLYMLESGPPAKPEVLTYALYKQFCIRQTIIAFSTI